MYPGAEALLESIRTTATERPVADAIVRKNTVDQVAASALATAADAQEQLADPNLIASYDVDLAQQAILGRLKGLLPNANLATIQDATKLGEGVVVAEAMAVQDAAAINLWVENAAIESAKIKELVADKIRAGILQAAISVSSTGSISAGGASLDSDGLELTETASEFSQPSVDRASKITPRSATPWAHYQFFRVAGVGWGTQVSAVGSGTPSQAGVPGQVRLDAMSGPLVGSARVARVVVQGGNTGDFLDTFVSVGPHLRVTDKIVAGGVVEALQFASGGYSVDAAGALVAASLRSTGNLSASGTIAQLGTAFQVDATGGVDARVFKPQFEPPARAVGAGGSTTFTHGLGVIPSFVQVWVQGAGGVWRTADNYDNGLFPWTASSTVIAVTNGSGASQTFRVVAFR